MNNQDIIKHFELNKAPGESLDNLLSYTGRTRIIYGYDADEKPNDHCYWDYEWQQWEENDEHFRNRLKGEVE